MAISSGNSTEFLAHRRFDYAAEARHALRHVGLEPDPLLLAVIADVDAGRGLPLRPRRAPRCPSRRPSRPHRSLAGLAPDQELGQRLVARQAADMGRQNAVAAGISSVNSSRRGRRADYRGCRPGRAIPVLDMVARSRETRHEGSAGFLGAIRVAAHRFGRSSAVAVPCCCRAHAVGAGPAEPAATAALEPLKARARPDRGDAAAARASTAPRSANCATGLARRASACAASRGAGAAAQLISIRGSSSSGERRLRAAAGRPRAHGRARAADKIPRGVDTALRQARLLVDCARTSSPSASPTGAARTSRSGCSPAPRACSSSRSGARLPTRCRAKCAASPSSLRRGGATRYRTAARAASRPRPQR